MKKHMLSKILALALFIGAFALSAGCNAQGEPGAVLNTVTPRPTPDTPQSIITPGPLPSPRPTVPPGHASVRIPVILYHGVMPDDRPGTGPASYYWVWRNNSVIMTERRFREHMQYLYDNDFNTVTAAQFEAWFFDNAPLPPNPVMLHFDDGYESDYLFAAPIMQEFGFTAINFIHTQPDRGPNHQRLTLTSFGHISRDQINRLRVSAGGAFEFASHSHAMHNGPHTIQGLTQAQVQADFRTSLAMVPMCLENWYAFTYGSFTQAAITGLRTEGVTIGWSTMTGYTYQADAYTLDQHIILPRFSIMSGDYHSGYGMTAFSAMVRGYR